jgi:prepilin-type N-terminal cleavage/methylation domain-containing protein
MLTKIRQEGFTLLEIVIAMAILAVGLLAVASMVHMVMLSNRMSRNMTSALNLAQGKIDDLRLTDYTSIAAGTESNLDEGGTEGAGIFNRAVSVSENFTPAVKIVTVSVTWSDKKPKARTVSMKTMIAGP